MRKYNKHLTLFLLGLLMFDDVHSYTRIMMHEMYEQDDNIDILLLGAHHRLFHQS